MTAAVEVLRLVVFLILAVMAPVVFILGIITGEDSSNQRRTLVWVACAWLMLGAAFWIEFSLAALLWYAAVTVGLALLVTAVWGLAQLGELAGEWPLPASLGGAVAGALLCAGAVVSAITGHRWLALIGLTATLALIGLGALAILEESPRPLARRHAAIVAITGTAVAGAGGVALLVLGPLVALDTSGSVVMRIIGGGFFAGFGGMAVGMAVGVRHVYRTDWGLSRTWQDGGVGSLMLLDTASLYYRAFFGVPDTVRAPDGTPVNAIRGLLDTIGRLVRARHPSRLVACLDADWRPAFRVAAIPTYKAHRLGADGTEDTPPALAVQVPVIEEVLRASGLASAGQPGFEADDVMATLSARSADPVDVVTGDRDLFQLVDDARGVRIIYTVRGLLNMDVIDEAAVAAKYGIPGRAYADYAALRGDPSDGLPGVPGVGEKTAAALINTFGSIDGITVALDAGHGGFPRGSRDKLEKARDYLDVALSVVRVVEDVPLPEIGGELPVVAADPDRLKELGERWGLGSSLTRFVTAVSQP